MEINNEVTMTKKEALFSFIHDEFSNYVKYYEKDSIFLKTYDGDELEVSDQATYIWIKFRDKSKETTISFNASFEDVRSILFENINISATGYMTHIRKNLKGLSSSSSTKDSIYERLPKYS